MRILIIAALAALQFGCVNLAVHRDDTSPSVDKKVFPLKAFLWAFVPGTKLPPASELCPQGHVQSLDFGMDTKDVLLASVTAGIFVPYRVEVSCSHGASPHQTKKN